MELATRERILETLRLSPNLSVDEMSRMLHLTRADIRYHLNALLRSGQVVQMPLKIHSGEKIRGRPAKSYQLSDNARADGLANLASALLKLIQTSASGLVALQRLAEFLFPLPLPSAPEMHLTQRLNAAVQTINQLPYQARWEAHAAGPQVFYHNCPYAAIIRQHPELCQVDELALERLTGMSASQSKKIDLDGPDSSVCIFKLARSESSPA